MLTPSSEEKMKNLLYPEIKAESLAETSKNFYQPTRYHNYKKAMFIFMSILTLTQLITALFENQRVAQPVETIVCRAEACQVLSKVF
jgi:hypothetical protein